MGIPDRPHPSDADQPADEPLLREKAVSGTRRRSVGEGTAENNATAGDSSNLTAHEKAPVLVVDDEDEGRELLRDALEDAGYVVVEASNGKEALTLLTTAGSPEPCLIVLDLNMPVMTGWELLAIVKGYYRLSRIPILVISGQPHREALA